MKSEWLTKEIFKKALEEKRVFTTTKIKTQKGITGYNLYLIKKNLDILWICGYSAYWSDNRECYHITACGTNRPLEIILSIGYNLGLKFHEIKQTQFHL